MHMPHLKQRSDGCDRTILLPKIVDVQVFYSFALYSGLWF
jgi:hypothetical protein